MIKKRILPISLAFIMALFFCSCSAAKSQTLIQETVTAQPTQPASKKPVVALVMKTLTNPFFVEMEKGAREAESKYGVDLIVRTGAQETSIEQQIQIVEELIVKKVDAIVIAPGSSTDLISVLKKAQDAGIKIVNIDNKLDAKASAAAGLVDVPFISVHNDEGAYLSVLEMTKKAVGGEAIIFEGIRDAENSQLRVAGAKKAFAEKTGIRIVATESANWKIDEAYTLAKKLITQHPKVKFIFCANDMMALGVAQYLKEKNLSGILLTGFDNLSDTRSAIQEGWILATIDQQADVQGYMGIEAAVKLIHGESVEKEIYIPVKVVTNETLTRK